jgi:GNAT superfamily N-acetyltransferase
MPKHVTELDLFMICREVNHAADRELPTGYTIRACREDEYEVWRDIQSDPAARDIYYPMLDEYFANVYAPRGKLFYDVCRLVISPVGKAVASCFIWRAYGKFTTLHWLKTLPELEGLGIGRALIASVLSEVAAGDMPIYLHTHPGCLRAIKLYSDFGFKLATNAKVGARENGLLTALPYFKENMPEAAYAGLRFDVIDGEFVRAVEGEEINQF